MANLTLSIDDETLRRARIRALEQDTSVNAVVRTFLASYAGDDRRTLEAVLAIAENANAGSEGTGRTWHRNDLYEERTGWPPSSTPT